MTKSVVLVGAYERYNFGDLLFALQTREYLKDVETRLSGPFEGTANEFLGEAVQRYPNAILAAPPSAVWVVGGEIGAVTLEYAYSMYADADDFQLLSMLPYAARQAQIEAITQQGRFASAYLPRMSASVGTWSSAAILNSVGLRSIAMLRGSALEDTEQALREASFISVRDQESSDLLTAMGVTHRVAPDLIHSMRLTHPHLAQPKTDLALVQLRELGLAELGVEELAHLLVSSSALDPFRIRLFTAGSAPGHDSPKLYRDVVAAARRLAPNRDIAVSASSDPVQKVQEIATAAIWIGTSLHGNIISTAFDVPRVGLKLDKVTRYATTWGETMPFDVAIRDLDAAATTAFALAPSLAATGRALELADLAQASVIAAAQATLASDTGDPTASRRDAHARLLANQQRLGRRVVDRFEPIRLKLRRQARAVLPRK